MEHIVVLMDAHGGVASWVQAVGAILALAVTIWLSRLDNRERRRAAATRARSAAIAVFPELVDVQAELSWALDQIEKGYPANDLGNFGPEDADTLRFWRTPVMPARLEALRPILYELGDAAEPAQRAYFALQRLRQYFKDFVRLQALDEIPENIWTYSAAEWEQTHALARAAQAKVKRAVEAIGRLL